MTDLNIAFWNLQNLFDTTASEIAADLEFTPQEGWTDQVLEQKLDRLVEVIAAMFGGNGPDLLGVCEIENRSLLQRLCDKINLVTGRSDLVIAHTESPDIRGIDTALIYSDDKFELTADPIGHLVHFRYPTRDIFEVPLKVKDNDSELIVFVTHWPSRISDDSEPFRIAVASQVGRLADRYLKLSLEEINSANKPLADLHPEMKQRWSRNILIMGDLNDDPFNTSVMNELQAANSEDSIEEEIKVPKDDRDAHAPGIGKIKKSDVARYLGYQANFYNLSWGPLGQPGEGTIHFTTNGGRNKQMFDQMIISRGLFYGLHGLTIDPTSFEIFAPKFMWTQSNRGDDLARHLVRPKKFDPENGKGYSDHFPVLGKLSTT